MSASLTFKTHKIQFRDTSIGGAVAWAWDFGDDATSTDQNPAHTYAEETATYAVELVVTDAAGRKSTARKLITVTPSAPAVVTDWTASYNYGTYDPGDTLTLPGIFTGQVAQYTIDFINNTDDTVTLADVTITGGASVLEIDPFESGGLPSDVAGNDGWRLVVTAFSLDVGIHTTTVTLKTDGAADTVFYAQIEVTVSPPD